MPLGDQEKITLTCWLLHAAEAVPNRSPPMKYSDAENADVH